MQAIAVAGTGLLFGLSLIAALGPQNLFVLQQGIRREHVALVVGVCTVSDVVMIAAGVGGAGAALDGRPWLVTVLGVGGAAFLGWYSASAARRAVRPVTEAVRTETVRPRAEAVEAGAVVPVRPQTVGSMAGAGAGGRGGLGLAVTPAVRVLVTCLTFTWLNPGVYLDTVVVLGPVSHSHGGHAWWFGAGAMLASALWFVALGFGARLVAPLFDRPRAWRVLDTTVAIVLAVTAVRLLVPVVQG